jgi:hypothetical protein
MAPIIPNPKLSEISKRNEEIFLILVETIEIPLQFSMPG